MPELKSEIVALTQRLLEAVAQGDWATYEGLCHPNLTCFEPEARGQVVAGLTFHRYYFDQEREGGSVANTICSPVVWPLGETAAVIAYSRLVQDGPVTEQCEETRVWSKTGGVWRHVHFHRSANG